MDQEHLGRFEERARRWRENAHVAANQKERDDCLKIAEGYEMLVQILSGQSSHPR